MRPWLCTFNDNRFRGSLLVGKEKDDNVILSYLIFAQSHLEPRKTEQPKSNQTTTTTTSSILNGTHTLATLMPTLRPTTTWRGLLFAQLKVTCTASHARRLVSTTRVDKKPPRSSLLTLAIETSWYGKNTYYSQIHPSLARFAD